MTHHYYGGSPYRSGGSINIVIAFFIMAFILAAFAFSSTSRGAPKSTYNREALSGTSFDNNCVIDELGWVDNVSRTERDLQAFHKKTGVQPFVYLKAYDPELTTDAAKIKYAEEFYEQEIDNEHTFLMVYFAEADADNDVGYMAHVVGHSAVTVMDAEAIDIFYHYWDNNWYSDKSTDAVIVDSFVSAAKRFMTKSNTMADVLKWIVIAIMVFGVFGFGIYRIKLKYKRDKEKAEETERILNTPIDKIKGNDDLADKYTK